MSELETPPHSWPKNFTDRLTAPTPRFTAVLRALTSGAMRGSLADADRIPIVRDGALPQPRSDELAVTWVGHASFVITIGGKTILTDPVWSASIPSIRRITPVGVAWSHLPPIDAVVISHNHYDHLDAATIKRLDRDTPIFAPAGLGRWFTKRGFRDVTDLDWYSETKLDDLEIAFVPAHHWSRRTPFDTCESLWGGWVLTSADHRVYFAGDTGYGHFFHDIGVQYPDIDVALLPIGAYTPRWFLRAWHMNPEEAVQACADLGAQRMGTMHWGTFVLSGEPVLEPLMRARAAWERAGNDRADLWDFAIGASHLLPR